MIKQEYIGIPDMILLLMKDYTTEPRKGLFSNRDFKNKQDGDVSSRRYI